MGLTPQAVEARRRADLFRAQNQFVMENGGQITSPPSARTVRIEIAADSALPERLIAHGYNPIYRGIETKTTYEGVVVVQIIEIDIR
jgi:hypothetical protein